MRRAPEGWLCTLRRKLAPLWFVALVASIAPPVLGQQPSSEAGGVAAEVLSNSGWLTEASRCPSTVMPRREAKDHLVRNSCRPGQLVSCLTRCTAGQPGACYWLGYALQQAGADQRAAEVLYQRSCKLGVMSGCTNRAAGMLNDGRDAPSKQACAAETFSRTCAQDDPWGCTMYAFHLSRGMGIRLDRDLALKVLERSCKYGPEDEACAYGMHLKKELLNGSKAQQEK